MKVKKLVGFANIFNIDGVSFYINERRNMKVAEISVVKNNNRHQLIDVTDCTEALNTSDAVNKFFVAWVENNRSKIREAIKND
jgi:hypothetical protein